MEATLTTALKTIGCPPIVTDENIYDCPLMKI